MTIKFEDIVKKEVYLHLFFWCLYITFPLLNYAGDSYAVLQWKTSNSNILLTIVFAYVCYYYFFPLKSKFKIISITIFTIVMTVLGTIVSKFLILKMIHQIDTYSFLTHNLATLGDYFFIGILFLSFYYIKKNYQLDQEKKIAEINSLKVQINPHFLLNTLNSIYAFSLEGNKKAPELILKLSDNFKYVLHEGQKNTVSIADDLSHIKDFIEINRLRWGEKINIIFTNKIENNQLQIAPLLLITFIENAVKYTSKLKGNYHKIEIEYMVKNNRLIFSCNNSFDKNYKLTTEWEESGVGLSNIQKRLDLMYKNQYNLQIGNTHAIFNVHLKLEL
ncbi:histidine kinase [uncultured Polaribacter sp.]|uniref:sensor histidine kinase n=1 Tax=uncultured Polaribacter sp. TaxID=174711 RepID=UPI00262EF275|nr:histidine kinase [uncultured Polaribacter sp.]